MNVQADFTSILMNKLQIVNMDTLFSVWFNQLYVTIKIKPDRNKSR